MGTRSRGLALTSLLVTLALTSPAWATAGQLHAGPILGGEFTDGSRGGFGGLVGLQGSYDFNDTWRLYANLQYSLAAADSADTPRSAITLAAGMVYVIDVLSILPWVGAGMRADVVLTPRWSGLVPYVEARGGADYLLSRSFGLTFQASYGFALANRDSVADVIDLLIGLRWTVDL